MPAYKNPIKDHAAWRTDPKGMKDKQRKLNKMRAKAMEKRVSIMFMGNTRGVVPMSGAGWRKGDNIVPLPNGAGDLYIECKMSSAQDNYGPFVRLEFDWFGKAERESRAMDCSMWAMAVHFFNFKGDYLIVPLSALPVIERASGERYEFNGRLLDETKLKNGKLAMSDMFHRNQMLNYFKEAPLPFPHHLYATQTCGDCFVISVEDFMTMCRYPPKSKKKSKDNGDTI